MKNLSIAGKLYLGFSIIILLTIITGGVSIYRLGNISSIFVEVQTQYFKILDNSMESYISLLTARRHEKDFIARKDKKYIDRMKVTLQEIQTLANELTAVSKQLGLSDIAAVGLKVIKAKEEYKASFGHVSSLILERGNKCLFLDTKEKTKSELSSMANDLPGHPRNLPQPWKKSRSRY